MQNLFLVPTDKPSMLWFNDLIDNNELILSLTEVETVNNQNIYITSDEEIKEGDWVLGGLGGIDIKKYGRYFAEDWKKIILTTDPDLIANGVQAIDDKFLEWFVKNPTVEYVTVERLEDGKYVDYLVDGSAVEGVYENYKIIIPQEESKCTCEEHDPYCCEVHGICPTCVKKEEPNPFELPKALPDDVFYQSLEPKQETLEDGAKYQADNMYSLDEIKNALKNGYGIKYFSEQKFLENLEQFKKK
jgi:hypothetical protein